MSRKYSQRGYQDDEPRERRGPSAPRERREGPRGRGLGAPTGEIFRCRDCGTEHDPGTITADSQCRKCGVSLHSCVQCRHFDTSARFECRQPITERVASKTKANDCGLFEPKAAQELGQGNRSEARDVRSAFDALFKI